jgi:sporulation-control protein
VVNEIELTFLATPAGMEIVLEADKRGGLFDSGQDTLTRFTVGHHDVGARDWNSEVDGWIRQLVEHRASYGSHATYGHADPYAAGSGYGHHSAHGSGHESGYGSGYESGHGSGHEGHRSGPGLGTAVAAGAAGLAVGVVGGLVAAEVVDEVGDFFEGDDEDGEED